MATRQWIKTVEINDRDLLVNEQLKQLKLEYYLLENMTDDLDFPITGYGVEVVQRMVDQTNCINTEHAGMHNVYVDKKRMVRLIKLLARHTVTPVTLPYILEDIV